jgi:hypothetical protein
MNSDQKPQSNEPSNVLPELKTWVNNIAGQFAGLGKVHFTDSHEIRELFCDFEILHLSHKVVEDTLTQKSFASWSLVARKPNEVK